MLQSGNIAVPSFPFRHRSKRCVRRRLQVAVPAVHPPDHGTSFAVSLRDRMAREPAPSTVQLIQENIMGKYLLAWLLGVPMFVLVIIYIFFH
jgi:hypothetical protein